MAFPHLVPISNLSSANNYFNESTLSISTVIPALRGRMDCRSYGPANIHASLPLKSGTDNPLKIRIDREDCRSNSRDDPNFEFSTYANATYFSGETICCSNLVYVWGKIDYTASPVIQHVDALGCNTTFEAVDVKTTFTGFDFDLDSQNPPQPLDHTARDTTLNGFAGAGLLLTGPHDYNELAGIDVYPQLLSPFLLRWLPLLGPGGELPISALGQPSARASVIAAIKFQHGIIQAQRLGAALIPANETNVTLSKPIRPGDNDARPRYNATVTDATGRRRVVQDAASTHVLVALLGVTLVLFIIGWACSPGTDVLPRSPTTIASVAALLAGGNIFSHLQPADRQALEDIAAALGGPEARFWMGWGNLPDEEGRLTGGENEAGVSQFGIFVVDEEKTELEQSLNITDYGEVA
ncbi:hypothetical protein F4824DRAFT_511536 [Ustulina deusta]|nr:hypothetical protein F4824DRAFT_511536 [Ustulina deusta]